MDRWVESPTPYELLAGGPEPTMEAGEMLEGTAFSIILF